MSFLTASGSITLFDFTSHTFTTGDGEFQNPPSFSSLQNEYPSWADDSEYFSEVAPGIQQFTIPEDADYRITAYGPSGGNNSNGDGGKGVIGEAVFNLSAGEKINILVGQRGANEGENPDGGNGTYNAGGGGTFVWKNSDISFGNSPSTSVEPLIAVGGGGGASDTVPQGQDASTGTSGTANASNSADGGTDGQGGEYVSSVDAPATAGAGWRGNGNHGHTSCDFNSQASIQPNLGGDAGRGGGNDENELYGGFGGGGGPAQRCGSAGGGGGGGYSGGGGGDEADGAGDSGGGGGGSFIDDGRATSSTFNGLYNLSSDGKVEIEKL